MSGSKMNQKISSALIVTGTVLLFGFASQYSGCNSSSSYCYNYYYCDYYYYDPFYPAYGYNSVYSINPAAATYTQADVSQAERAPESIINVENIVYIAKTGAPTDTDLTPADFEDHYPCGAGDEALTVCADATAAPDDSDRLMIMFKTEGLVPQADPVNHFVLGFAFDADNVVDNNFVPEQDQAGDYFGHTDKWYKTTYTPAAGWTLEVFDASGPTPVAVASHARLVIHQNIVAIVIPASEFAVNNPAARISLFRHTGDFGLGPDQNWSGLVYPKIGDPLIQPNVAPID
jgi:hypothetical protein